MWVLLGAADRWGPAAHDAEDSLTLAPLIGPWVLDAWEADPRRGFGAYGELFDETVRPLASRMSIPRRTLAQLKEMLWLWMFLRKGPDGRGDARMVSRRAFPLALAFLRLDLMARDCPLDVLHAWEALAEQHGAGTSRPAKGREPSERRSRRGRGRGRRGGRGGRGGRRGDDAERGGLGAEADAWAPAPEPD